ncbi:MAG: acyl-CoA thioesterase [Myxococcota bacterium]|nr:acyl-CoA thioesterase [Myxococcota bacterium]
MSDPSTASDAPGVFTADRQVAAGDLDALGHVNNVVWVRYVVELAEAHAEAVGLGAAALGRRGYGWVVRRHDVRYHRGAGPGTRLVGRTWIEAMRGARCIRCTRFESADGTLRVEARTEWAFVSLATGRPRRIPGSLARAFGVDGAG